MSNVIGTSVKLLFCEGKTDVQFLNKFVKEDSTTTVVEIGDKKAIPSFVRGYTGNRTVDNYIALRDRDLDFSPPDVIGLIPTDKKYLFTTHRAALENYWFDGRLIAQYLAWLNQTPNYRNRGLTPPDETFIKSKIREAAQNIRNYTAARWALADLKRTLGKTELRDKWLENSGDLPNDLSPEHSCRMAAALLERFRHQASGADTEIFEEHFRRYQLRFDTTEFYDRDLHLVWFHGKDMRTAFGSCFSSSPEMKGWNFAFTKYCEAFCNLEFTELKFDLEPHADLLDLQRRLREF